MVTLSRQRVQEVHLKCRFCAYQHFNTRNKGTIYIQDRYLVTTTLLDCHRPVRTYHILQDQLVREMSQVMFWHS